MFARIFLLLTLVPIVELSVMMAVHGAIAERFGWRTGLAITLGTIVLTGVVGAALAQRQGVAALRELQAAIARGQFPGRALIDAALIVMGGALLLTPGYITDLLGLSLLFPPTRAAYRRWLSDWIRRKIEQGAIRVNAQSTVNFGPGSFVDDRPAPGGPVVIDVTPEEGKGADG